MPAMNVNVRQKTLCNLEAAVRRTGLNKSRITDCALTKYLAELEEDQEDARLADEVYAKYIKNEEKAVPAEEVYRNLGL